jgi:hypothetical protein
MTPQPVGEEWQRCAADENWYSPDYHDRIRTVLGTQHMAQDKRGAQETRWQQEWSRQYEQDQARLTDEEHRRTTDVDSDEALCDEDFLAKLQGVVDVHNHPGTWEDVADLCLGLAALTHS